LRSRQLRKHSRISQHFMEPKVHYRVHKSPPLASILSQTNLVHTTPSYPPAYVLVFLVVSFFLASPPKFCMHSSSPHACYMPRPSHCPGLNQSNYTWRRVQVRSSSLCSFLQPPINSSLFGPNILLSAVFSNTLSLCSSLNVRGQVSRPYRTTGKIIVLYICNFYVFRQ
jgi:hypothetical protein